MVTRIFKVKEGSTFFPVYFKRLCKKRDGTHGTDTCIIQGSLGYIFKHMNYCTNSLFPEVQSFEDFEEKKMILFFSCISTFDIAILSFFFSFKTLFFFFKKNEQKYNINYKNITKQIFMLYFSQNI